MPLQLRCVIWGPVRGKRRGATCSPADIRSTNPAETLPASPEIATAFVSDRKAEKKTHSAMWKRSERQRKESCCVLTAGRMLR